jgi:ATP-dependent DNA helicase RecQ
VSHQVYVLLGTEPERVQRFGRAGVSTFGIGDELDAGGWRDLYRQLIALGLLAVDVTGHGALRLTEASRPLLRGDTTLRLRRKGRPERAARRSARGGAAPGAADPALWEALRELRGRLAREQGVPAYVIFHDATLMEMAAARPATLTDLGAVSGVGERKLAAYGPAFLEVLQAHGAAARREESGDTVAATLALVRQGLKASQVAERRGLKAETVHGHLADAIARGEVGVEEVLELEARELDSIRFALEQEALRLRPVYEALEGRYSYGVLRCVRAAMGAEG